MCSDGFSFGGNSQRSVILMISKSFQSNDKFLKAGVMGKLGTHSIRKGFCMFGVKFGPLRDVTTILLFFLPFFFWL